MKTGRIRTDKEAVDILKSYKDGKIVEEGHYEILDPYQSVGFVRFGIGKGMKVTARLTEKAQIMMGLMIPKREQVIISVPVKVEFTS